MAGQFIESQLSIVSKNSMESLKCVSLVPHIRIYWMKFRVCDSQNKISKLGEF